MIKSVPAAGVARINKRRSEEGKEGSIGLPLLNE